mmetsp:Transcript_46346/g.91873  ORF Transcript_46346/g.91873 Transcript_46346/m.91873 type:complete len:707 (-) Transcript_46346:195-2315(-)
MLVRIAGWSERKSRPGIRSGCRCAFGPLAAACLVPIASVRDTCGFLLQPSTYLHHGRDRAVVMRVSEPRAKQVYGLAVSARDGFAFAAVLSCLMHAAQPRHRRHAVVKSVARVARAYSGAAKSAQPVKQELKFEAKLLSLVRGSEFGMEVSKEAKLAEVASARLVVFGELHAMPPATHLELEVAQSMLAASAGRVHVVMEHFSFEMQHLLDEYTSGQLSFDGLNKAYAEIGTEGHDVYAYKDLLQFARDNAERVQLHGGFIPRTFAKIVMRESLEKALEAAKSKGYLAESETCEGSNEHYNYFEAMISGRDPHDTSVNPQDTFRKMFPAQIIKDAAMAHKVNQLLDVSPAGDKILVICGAAHMFYNCGVPERIFASHPKVQADTYRIYTRASDHRLPLTRTDEISMLESAFGKDTDPADLCLIFEEVDAPTQDELEEQVKAETASAYDKVGETAAIEGNLRKAEKMMARIGYSEEEISIAGRDAFNYQGVGNPHRAAAIQPGEVVLDLGSGLGVDSFIAAARAGEKGRVLGLDISKAEVAHAAQRAKDRAVPTSQLDFINADMEKIPLDDNSVDCIISNGAFCLAPNKPAAFREVFRVLKPGGRFSICTSTVKLPLEVGVNWPICMRMFEQLDNLKPICETVGFASVGVDSSDSAMQFTLDLSPEESKTSEDRNKVHVGSEEFKHLEQFDMNEICARVVVTGTKPA